jgi:site-specific DNA recombinase
MDHLCPPAHEALVSEQRFIAAQDINAARGPSPRTDLAGPEKRRYLLSGLLVCGACGRRMESAWSNGKPAYRCRHGHTWLGQQRVKPPLLLVGLTPTRSATR